MAELSLDDREKRLAINRRKFLGYFPPPGWAARFCPGRFWP